MPRLRELQAQFLKVEDVRTYRHVDTLAEADGISFVCPKCYADPECGNGSVRGAHSVICWFRGKVPDSMTPGPGRWTPEGSGYDDLSFVPGNPPIAMSVLLTGGCKWHGFIRSGEATLS
jgi:hypothetical protein